MKTLTFDKITTRLFIAAWVTLMVIGLLANILK